MASGAITYKFVDTGHWLARCDHVSKTIELNKQEFFKLSPFYQEYIWIHEHVHLMYDVYDEYECNRITDQIFISRAKDEEDRVARIRFVVTSNDSSKSNIWGVVISAAVTLITGVANAVITKRNSGYYSLSGEQQRQLVDNYLSTAFMESLLTSEKSAKTIFWSYLQPSIPRKKEQTYEGWLKNNSWCKDLVSKYEAEYGFGFDEITPIDKWAHPEYRKKYISIIAGVVVVVVVIVVLFSIIRKKK